MDGDENNEPSALALLLPFYVNGTLSADDQTRIETALATDADLRAELAAVRELAALVGDGGAGLAPATDAPPDRLNALMRRIDEAGASPAAAQPQPRRALPRRGAGLGRFLPRPTQAIWKPAFAAAAVVVVVQAGLLLNRPTPSEPYAVLAGPETAGPSRSQRLLLRISPDSRWADVTVLLSSHDLTIVGGPHGDGIDVALSPDRKLEEELRQLRASPLVEFVGPAS